MYVRPEVSAGILFQLLWHTPPTLPLHVPQPAPTAVLPMGKARRAIEPMKLHAQVPEFNFVFIHGEWEIGFLHLCIFQNAHN